MFLLCRFGYNPFRIRLTAKVPNAHYSADANVPQPDVNNIRTQDLLIQPVSKSPRRFFDGMLGASSLFDKIDVTVNGWDIKNETMAEHGYIYQCQNRLYMSREARVKKYGRDFPRISNEADGKLPAAATGELNKDMLDSVQSLQFAHPVTGADKQLSFGADGIWPWDKSCNIINALTNQVEAQNPYLPPGMEITIKLHKRVDFEALLQRPDVLDATVYNSTTAATAVAAADKITWDVKDLYLVYEAITCDDKTMADRRVHSEFFVDIPRILTDKVAAGDRVSHNAVRVPPGTRLVIMSFMYSDHVYPRSAHHKCLSPRFHWPVNAKNVAVSFEGQAGLLLSRGFDEVGTKDGPEAATSAAYYDYLIGKKIYYRTWDKLFPAWPLRTYDACMIFDMADQQLTANSQLNVDVRYSSDGGPLQYYLVTTMVQQYRYDYHNKQKMAFTLLV